MSNIVNNLVEDYIRTTLKEKDGLLRELEEYANEHNVPIVHKEVSELLKVLLKIQKPKRILEVGCAIGYSSILFASVLDEDVEIITVERNEKMIEKAKENINNLLNKFTYELLNKYKTNGDIEFAINKLINDLNKINSIYFCIETIESEDLLEYLANVLFFVGYEDKFDIIDKKRQW